MEAEVVAASSHSDLAGRVAEVGIVVVVGSNLIAVLAVMW